MGTQCSVLFTTVQLPSFLHGEFTTQKSTCSQCIHNVAFPGFGLVWIPLQLWIGWLLFTSQPLWEQWQLSGMSCTTQFSYYVLLSLFSWQSEGESYRCSLWRVFWYTLINYWNITENQKNVKRTDLAVHSLYHSHTHAVTKTLCTVCIH